MKKLKMGLTNHSKPKSRLMPALLIIALSGISTIGRTEEKTKPSFVTCDQIIKACDAALDAKDKQIEALTRTQTEILLSNTKLAKETSESRDDLNAWYRNPVTMVGLGIISGLLASKFVLGVGK